MTVDRERSSDGAPLLDILRSLRDSWKDQKSVTSKRSWFIDVALLLKEISPNLGEIEPIQGKIYEFSQLYTSEHFKKRAIRETDIFGAKELIGEILGEMPDLEIEQIKKVSMEVRDDVQDIKTKLDEDLNRMYAPRLLGWAISGSEKRPDGRDWTQEDIDREWAKEGEELEDKVRRQMAGDLRFALEAMVNFFTQSEHPARGDVLLTVDMISALCERFLVSKEQFTYEWPSEETEGLRQAYLLEITRQLILKPADTLLGNDVFGEIAVYGDPREFQTDEMRKVRFLGEEDRLKWKQLDRERIMEELNRREPEEWEAVVGAVDEELTRYLRVVSQSRVEEHRQELAGLSRIVRNGRRILSAEAISEAERIITDEAAFAEKISQAKDLNQTLACIKDSCGVDASFRSFFQELMSMDLPET